MSFNRTEKQAEAIELLSTDATNCALFGGSGSGKTFVALYALCVRALRVKSTHCIIRSTQRDCRQKIAMDMFPCVLNACFPGVFQKDDMNRTDWFYVFPNGSRIWFYGIDGDGIDKILGPSYATYLFEECSELDWPLVQKALTRLRQKTDLRVKAYYTFNPPQKSHWTYRVFIEEMDPVENAPLRNPANYCHLLMNPHDNLENLDDNYLQLLEGLSKRERDRFLWGKFGEPDQGNLFHPDWIYHNRIDKKDMPREFERVAIGVDPAVSTKRTSDSTGIVCVGLYEGEAYILEDASGIYTPKQWADKVNMLYEKWQADVVVAERNHGGDLVKENITRNHPHIYVSEVVATRGKYTRAEPIAALYERGLVHHTGNFEELCNEMIEFNPDAKNQKSPDRLDSVVWSIWHLMIDDQAIKPIVSASEISRGQRESGLVDFMENEDLWNDL
jgi:PBSX family phage terminase large subunit